MKSPAQAVAIAACVIIGLAAGSGAAGELAPATRCFGLIALFDEIVVHRFDYRLLQIESWELAEARRRRDQAEAYCRTGRYWFGIKAIDDALERIGNSPLGADEAPRDER